MKEISTGDKFRFGFTILLLVGGFVLLSQIGVSGVNMPFNAADKCYPYDSSNVSYGGVGDHVYYFGKCYMEECTYRGYETKEVCRGGFIGIGMSCYEASESHYESYKICRTKCYIAKTGEKC